MQGFIASFYLFTKATFSSVLIYADNINNPGNVKINSTVKAEFFNRSSRRIDFAFELIHDKSNVFANVNAEILTYRNVDSLTYSQFAKKQYKELRTTGNIALKKKIDFYELRIRLGIMYFDCENYQKSSKHLGKANSMNPTDSTIYEYLYFSYLFSGREAEANKFIHSLNKSVGNSIKSKKNLGYVIEINSGIVTNKQSESEFTNYKGSENIYAETNLNTQAIFNSLIFKKSFNKKMDFYA